MRLVKLWLPVGNALNKGNGATWVWLDNNESDGYGVNASWREEKRGMRELEGEEED